MSGNWREVSANWLGENAFEGKNPSGGCVQLGTWHGQNGISPMELLLIGVAGCTGMDIVSILEKQRQKMLGFKLLVRGKRANEFPKVYTEIDVVYLLVGEQLDPTAVERAIQLSEEKYCSASAMMRPTAKIRSYYRIYPSGETIPDHFDDLVEFTPIQ